MTVELPSEVQLETFPVLAVLAPAAAGDELPVEFPGDPIALYSLLSEAIERLLDQDGLPSSSALRHRVPDFVPGYQSRPLYFRPRDATCYPADWLIDYRVWNSASRKHFELLVRLAQPELVLVSALSPALPIALDIIRCVRAQCPDAIVALGGRHLDETTMLSNGGVRLSRHHPANYLHGPLDIATGAFNDALPDLGIDVFAAGDGYAPTLALLEMAAKRSGGAKQPFSDLLAWSERIHRRGRYSMVLAHRDSAGGLVVTSHGPPLGSNDVASPYSWFIPSTQFAPFARDAHDNRPTAHVRLGDTCPFDCTFCSEGRSTTRRSPRLPSDAVELAIRLVKQAQLRGAGSVFFDDSVFFAGSLTEAMDFCDRVVVDNDISSMQFGIQTTFGLLANLDAETRSRYLERLAGTGVTYIYLGIESLDASVLRGVDKYKQLIRRPDWWEIIQMILTDIKRTGILVGTSVLFGLRGETPATYTQTIERVQHLIGNGLIDIVSPNLLTLHPGTPLGASVGLAPDAFELLTKSGPPYTLFEEGNALLLSPYLTEEDVWDIAQQCESRWGSRMNRRRMRAPELPALLSESSGETLMLEVHQASVRITRSTYAEGVLTLPRFLEACIETIPSDGKLFLRSARVYRDLVPEKTPTPVRFTP